LYSHKYSYKKYSLTGEAGCKKLYSYIKNLGGWSSVKIVPLCESTVEYCFQLENRLRPLPNLGWNTRVGGDFPVMYKREVTAETKAKLALVRSSWVMSKGTKDRLSKERKGSGNPMYGTLPWDNPSSTFSTRETWAKADKIYTTWISTRFGYKRLAKLFPNLNFNSITSIVHKFQKGWNPLEDLDWTKYKEYYDFKNQ
jgi:hypothetical protein